MKSFVVIAVVLGAVLFVNALSDEQKLKLQEYGKACIAESGVDPELVTRARQGDFATNEPKLGIFTYCLSRKLNLQNEAGEPNPEVVEEKLTGALGDAAIAKELVQKCLITKDTKEETALQSFMCYHQNRKVTLF